MNICEMEKCTGCGLCMNICAHGAISFSKDGKFMEYPMIDQAKCVECGVCKMYCPTNSDDIRQIYPQACYAGYRTGEERLDSASGGLASKISECFIKNGIVAGVELSDKGIPHFSLASEILELEKFKGSKYVQAQPEKIYEDITFRLNKGKKCLFIGTPCQVNAMYQFAKVKAKKQLDNLYTIDLLCHGVIPTQFFIDELEYLEGKIGKITNVTFRTNRTSAAYKFCAFRNEKLIYTKSYYEQPYYYGFVKSITLRESCYHCRFANIERAGDVSLGDFIGLGTDNKYEGFTGKKENISLVLVNTEKGRELLSCLSMDDVRLWNREIQEAADYCPALKGHEIKNEKAVCFRKNLATMSSTDALRSIIKRPLKINSFLKYVNFILRKLGLTQVDFR